MRIPRFLSIRTLFRFVAPISLVAVLVAPSILIPQYLGRGAEPVTTAPSTDEDRAASDTLRDAYRHELSGDLDQALEQYRKAANAKSPGIRTASSRGSDRVEAKLMRVGSLYQELKSLQVLSLRLRVPLIMLTLLYLLSRLRPRRGIALRPFAMNPRVDAEMSAGFSTSLLNEINRIVRAYSSDQLERIGVKVTLPNLLADSEQEDIWKRALDSLRGGELKAIATFSVAELVRFLRYFGSRPAYILSGNVLVRQTGARAQALLTRGADGSTIGAWEAESVEVEAVQRAPTAAALVADVPVQEISPCGVVLYGTAGDPRRSAELLNDLAAVLACKIWCRLTQGARTDARPGSWQTIFNFVRALNALEQQD
jgi:hypothetical protein